MIALNVHKQTTIQALKSTPDQYHTVKLIALKIIIFSIKRNMKLEVSLVIFDS